MARTTVTGLLGTALALSGLAGLAGPAGPAGAAAADTPGPDRPRPVALGGTPVAVSTDPQDPTVLTAGWWADTLDGPGSSDASVHRFRYQRTMADSTVLVGVVATSTEESNDSVEVEVTTAGTTCASDNATSGYPVPGATYGASVAVGPGEDGSRDLPCVSADALEIAVSRGTSDDTSDLPVAIRVVEEAPVLVGRADLPTPAESPSVEAPEVEAPVDRPGGASLTDAPEVGSGTYAARLPEGAQRLWRVHLDWGQSLAVAVDLPAQDAATAATLEGGAPDVDLTLLNPLLDTFGGEVEDTAGEDVYGSEPTTLREGAPPVAFLNRFDGLAATVPGDYYVSLAVSPADPDRAPVEVPVELSIRVGDAEGAAADPPGFAQTVTGPRGTAGPAGYDRATPYLVDADTFGADVAGTPRRPGDDAGGGLGSRPVAGLVLGALSLGSCAAGVVLLRRRGRPDRRLSRAAAR